MARTLAFELELWQWRRRESQVWRTDLKRPPYHEVFEVSNHFLFAVGVWYHQTPVSFLAVDPRTSTMPMIAPVSTWTQAMHFL